ncbi:MAG: ABC transporter substrate-binding protein [Patescibacteria group bacterium]
MAFFIRKQFNRLILWLKNISQRRRSDVPVARQASEIDRRLVFSLSSSRWPSVAQFRYLPRILSPVEKRIITFAMIVAITALALLGWRFYERHIVMVPTAGGEYTEALIGAPQYINPLFSQTNDVDQDLVALTFSNLFKLNPSSGLVPDLVSSYELSEDQKVYTLHIRQDVKWHDGQDLTANDVLFTIGTIQDPAFKSPLLANLRGVEAKKIDDYTLSLTLLESFAPFLSNLTFGILPEHIWSDVDISNALLVEYNLKPIGSGPYKFQSLTRDRTGIVKSYTLEPNEDYYLDPPYISKLTLRFYPDLETAGEAVKNKNVEGISYLVQEQKAKFANSHLSYQSLGLPQYTSLFFQGKKNERLKDLNVRSALDRAIDKQSIINEVLGGDGLIVNGPILPGFLGHNPNVSTRPYDPELAKELLEEAGWELPAEGDIRRKADSELAFSLTTVDQPQFLATAEMIKEYWEAIGARVELITVGSSQAQRDIIKPREYDILLYGEIIGIDPDPYPFWHSSQQTDPGLSLAIFFNKQADKLLEQARQTCDTEQRNLKYMEFQNILAEEIPAIFLNSPVYTYGLSGKIKGFVQQNITVPSDRFTDINNWYIKTRREWR